MSATPIPREIEQDPRLSSSSRLTFRRLSVVPDGGDYVVGDPSAGVFLSIPEIGIIALRALQAGRSIGSAAKVAADETGVDVDVLEFAETLVEAGFVSSIDGVAIEATTSPGSHHDLLKPSRVARVVFSGPAWAAYTSVMLVCAVSFVAEPSLWPSLEDFFFYPNPAICIAVMTILGIGLAAVHELCHVLAARAAGVGATLRISRRMFLPVIETDVSQLWAVAPRQRYGPFLAGMAFDTMLLGSCIALRLAWMHGVLNPPPLLLRLAAALVLRQVLIIGFQGLVFLRTDLYAALITALRCRDLYRVTTLLLRRVVRRLSPAGQAELDDARPRDLAVARWFVITYVLGGAFLWWFFIKFFIPGTVIVAIWMFLSLGNADIGSSAFWQALVVGMFAAFQAGVPLTIFVVERLRARLRLAG